MLRTGVFTDTFQESFRNRMFLFFLIASSLVIGTIGLVAFNAAYLILGVWVVLGWKSGIWNRGFPLSAALLVFAFVVLFRS